MNYTWRIFKYSKFIEKDEDRLSHCKKDIESIGQSIIHSQFDTQGIRKEKWLHIFMEGNRFLEVSIFNNTLDISLNIHNPPIINVTKLEHLVCFRSAKMCLKGRLLAIKFVDSNKKFQLAFFNSEEALMFFNKFSDLIEVTAESKNALAKLKFTFLEMFKGERLSETEKKEMKTQKTQKQLIKEYLSLLQDL